MGESASVQMRLQHPRAIAQGRMPPLNRITEHCALFLDFDGTLMNRERRPDQVAVDGGLLYLLDELYVATAGAVAVLSGRSIEDLDTKLAPLCLPLAGVHGAQRRRADGRIEQCTIPAAQTWQTRMTLRLRLRRYPGLFLEDRGCAFAVHHRGASSVTVSRLRADLAALAATSRGMFEVAEAEDVIELRPPACDKGAALERFMSEAPFAGRLPIYIGDDQTDRSAFDAVARANGLGISVGARATAPWRLSDAVAVRSWLRSGLGLDS
ncbi:MAG: trehalose-phosphatase [Steroidobacteraceae bacterium]